MWRNLILIFFFSLVTHWALGQKEFQNSSKFSPAFKEWLQRKMPKDSIDLIVSFKKDKEIGDEVRVLTTYQKAGVSIIRIAPRKISSIISDSNLLFVELKRFPKEELTTGAFDLSTNRINLVHHQYPQLTGDAVNLSIKEQRFDTLDIDFKGRTFNSGLSASTTSTHASIMATIIAGGGNSSSYSKGVAWGANITSSNFANLLPDPDSVFKKFKITVQNHSYGTGIENYYGNDAAAYDVQVWNNPELLHVFSAGNSGSMASTSGAYAGLAGFATLTGSFKMSKNTLSIGHIDSFYTVPLFSSKGPAYDGRIKPELVAFGEDGSSGAAAITTGVAALLSDAFIKKYNSLPTASLLKAILINTAQDIGPKGPDFISGFGAVNAKEAMAAIMENHFFQSDLRATEIKTFSVEVPPNAGQLKVTLTWTDTAAAPNATKALVNDLDLVIKNDSTGEDWLPWELSHNAQIDSLNAVAKRGKDTLNNTEQVTIENISAGRYTIQIKGSKIISTKQPFSVAYLIEPLNSFSFTYPSGSDLPIAGNTAVIRWQSNRKGSGSLWYAINGGQWIIINPNAALENQYFKWTIPDTAATMQLRMSFGTSTEVVYSDSFIVSKQTALQVGFNCPDSFLLFWNRQRIPSYKMYQLGKKYLEPMLRTNDSAYIFIKTQYPSLYYAVEPLINNKPGLRSYTINYTTQGVGCYLRSFYAINQNNKGILSATLGSVYEVSSIVFQKVMQSGIVDILTIKNPSTNNFSAVDSALTQGINNYRLAIHLNNGQVVYSPIESISFLPNFPVIIYPNPATQGGQINIIVKVPFTYIVDIYDALGKKIITKKLDGLTSKMDASSLTKGLYFIKIRTKEGNLSVQKLVVQ